MREEHTGKMKNLQKVKRDGLISLPKAILKALQINEGDYVTTQPTKDGILVRVIDLENGYRTFSPA